MRSLALLACGAIGCGSVVAPSGEQLPAQVPTSPPPLHASVGVEVVTQVKGPRGIAVRGDDVYVTSFGDPGIFTAKVTGGPAKKIADALRPTYVAVDENRVYWTDLATPDAPGSVGSVARTGGAARLLATDLFQPNSATLIGGYYLCWAQGRLPGSVECVPTTGGVRTIISAAESWPMYVATKGSALCWSRSDHGGSIACSNGDLGSVRELARELAHVWMLALDATHAYWVTRHGAIRRVSLTGGPSESLVEADPSFSMLTHDLALDDTHVYWLGPHGGAAAVRKIPKAGGSVTDLAIDEDQPMGITVDATHVYWTSWRLSKSGAVLRVAK